MQKWLEKKEKEVLEAKTRRGDWRPRSQMREAARREHGLPPESIGTGTWRASDLLLRSPGLQAPGVPHDHQKNMELHREPCSFAAAVEELGQRRARFLLDKL